MSGKGREREGDLSFIISLQVVWRAEHAGEEGISGEPNLEACVRL